MSIMNYDEPKTQTEKENLMVHARKMSFAVSITGLAILLALVTVLIAHFVMSSDDRIINQNQQYLNDTAEQSLKNMNDLFSSSEESIMLIARLCEQAVTDEGKTQASPAEYTEFIRNMQDETAFNFVRYVDKEGQIYAADGSVRDGKSREYYIKGMQGESGVCYVGNSMFTGGRLIAFYTPVYDFQGAVDGVIYGSLNTTRLAERMESQYFGIPSKEYICLRDGTICYGYGDTYNDYTIYEYLEIANIIDEKTLSELRYAFDNGESLGYSFTSSKGTGNVFVSPMADPNFMLVMTFPAEAGEAMMNDAKSSAMVLAWAIIILFSIYAFVIMGMHIRNNRALVRENADMYQIVDTVKQLFNRFVLLNLKDNTYEYLEDGDSDILKIESSGKLSDWLKHVSKLHSDNVETKEVLSVLSLDKLREMFSGKNWLYQYEYKVQKSGRWERMSLIRIDRVMKGSPRRILVAIEDITEIKEHDARQREALEAAFHAAEFANKAKSDFLSRMSHDIRTPMNAIVGITTLMEGYKDDPEKIEENLVKINSASNHLLGLINEVLDMSKIESGKFALNESPFKLTDMVRDITPIVESQAKAKHQELTIDAGGIQHNCVLGDSQRLQQIFINIISNAVKYTPAEGHIHVALREKKVMSRDIAEYDFIFQDDGIGMEKEFLDKIFLPFERAEDDRTNKVQGTGLGMTIIRNIVQLMGGNITVESELGVGSVFTVQVGLKVLPDCECEDGYIGNAVSVTAGNVVGGSPASISGNAIHEAASDIDGKPDDDVPEFAGYRALIVDDNELNLEIFDEILKKQGIESDLAMNGEEAVEKFRENAPGYYDVIFMDIQMPIMNGYEATRVIRGMAENKELGREDASEIPIIAVTANTFAEEIQEAYDAGVNEHIAKPISMKRIIDEMRKWVKR